MKNFMALLILFLALVSLNANELSNDDNGLGFSLGLLSGSGFTYQHRTTKSLYKITMGIITEGSGVSCNINTTDYFIYHGTLDTTRIFKKNCKDIKYSGNVGLEYRRYLRKFNNTRVYFSFGSSLFYSSRKNTTIYYKQQPAYPNYYQLVIVGDKEINYDTDYSINTGVALGIEYKFSEYISSSFGIPSFILSFTDSGLKVYMLIPQVSIMFTY